MTEPEIMAAVEDVSAKLKELKRIGNWLADNGDEAYPELAIETDALADIVGVVVESLKDESIRFETALKLINVMLDQSRENMRVAQEAIQKGSRN